MLIGESKSLRAEEKSSVHFTIFPFKTEVKAHQYKNAYYKII